jgi:uncharacterized protein DUF6916
MTDVFTIEMFSGHENSKFLMHYGDSQTAELELISVKDVGSSPRQSQFSLVFKGPPDGPAAQNIFRLEHEKLGALDLFLVPIARDKDGFSYEAIFNRMIE